MMDTPDSPPETQTLSGPSSSFTGPQPQYNGGKALSKTEEASKINHGVPGSSYSSKKFQEDYERAYNSLIDKNWDPGKL